MHFTYGVHYVPVPPSVARPGDLRGSSLIFIYFNTGNIILLMKGLLIIFFILEISLLIYKNTMNNN